MSAVELGRHSVRWSWILFQFHNETEVPNFLPKQLGAVGHTVIGWWFRLALGTFPKSLIFIGKFLGSGQKHPPTDHSQITTTRRILFQDFNQPGFQDPFFDQPGFQRTQLVVLVQHDAEKETTPGLWESDLSSESISAADMQRQGMNLGGMNGVGTLQGINSPLDVLLTKWPDG